MAELSGTERTQGAPEYPDQQELAESPTELTPMTGESADLTLADKLNLLWEAKRQGAGADAKTYSNRAVATALSEMGVSVTAAYLGDLRSGAKDNPGIRLIEGLASFFAVSPSYLLAANTPSDVVAQQRIHDQLNQLVDLRQKDLIKVGFRFLQASDDLALTKVVEAMMEQIIALRSTDGRKGTDPEP